MSNAHENGRMKSADAPTVLIVPGLRDHVSEHWQTLLAARLPQVRTVPTMGPEDIKCADRIKAIEREIAAIKGSIVIVAHSGGCVMAAHWARTMRHADAVRGVLLATPPDFDRPMPAGYPSLDALQAGGWLPVPRERLPFRSLVTARAWGSETVDLGNVGHLNPAPGFGAWPMAEVLMQQLATE